MNIVVPIKYSYLKESKDQLLIATLNNNYETSKQILITKKGKIITNIPLPNLAYYAPDYYTYNTYGTKKGLLKVSINKACIAGRVY